MASEHSIASIPDRDRVLRYIACRHYPERIHDAAYGTWRFLNWNEEEQCSSWYTLEPFNCLIIHDVAGTGNYHARAHDRDDEEAEEQWLENLPKVVRLEDVFDFHVYIMRSSEYHSQITLEKIMAPPSRPRPLRGLVIDGQPQELLPDPS